jgi:purine-binding chemotaxis protein CheW
VSPGSSPHGDRGSTQLSTFVVNGYLFGARIATVQEVVHHQPMTRVPLAPPAVGGLINLRGQVITAIDLRRRLGFPDRPAGGPPMDVIVRTRHGSVSLLVDRIGDGVEVSADAFEEPPETLRGVARELILGAYKLDGALLLLLDVERAVEPQGDHGARAHP